MSGAASRQIACSWCGAILEHQPEPAGDRGAARAALTCPRCGATQPIAATAPADKQDYHALLDRALAAGAVAETGVLDCGTCGAQTTLPASVISERCPFCGQPSVTPSTRELLRPAALLHFALDERQARARVVAWERSLWFRPGRLGPDGGAWRMSAVYLPYWSFDWDVSTAYHGARGVKVDDDTKWTATSGMVRTRLAGSTVFASKSVDRAQGAELEPWDTDRVVGYQDDYLLGIRAETSALSCAQAGELGHRLLERQITYEIERDIGGDAQRISESMTRYHEVSVRLVLMPIWVTHYRHGGRDRRVVVNARSGEVIGARPLHRGKVWAAAMAPLIVALVGGGLLPSLLSWRPAAAWRAHLACFWGTLGVEGMVAFVVGSMMSASAKRRGPSRHRELYVSRPGPGTTGLRIDPAATWQGALQDDGESRGTLVQALGFGALFVSLFPCLSSAMFDSSLLPVLMMHGFAAISLAMFVWAARAAGRDRDELLAPPEIAPASEPGNDTHA